ncbi:MAG: hypothetical protein WB440_19665 [Steroidobacteraceae bacterium]|jgi:hypothetical protein
MKVMIEEIARKKAEAESAQLERERRRQEQAGQAPSDHVNNRR